MARKANQEDTIVEISPQLEKYFGFPGKMLKPSLATVDAHVRQVPAGKLITIDKLREKLAREFHVETTCPFDTKLALRELANIEKQDAPYWRVVRKNGELLAYFPGGVEEQARKLLLEGFKVETNHNTRKVNLSGHLE